MHLFAFAFDEYWKSAFVEWPASSHH